MGLVYAHDSDLTYNSIRFDTSLQIFKSPNIFWPQIHRKRSDLVMMLAVKRKL